MASRFLAYRSKLNSFEFPIESVVRSPAAATEFEVGSPPNSETPKFFNFGGNVPQKNAFRAERISAPRPNKTELGKAFFMVLGGAVILDDMRYVHTVMTNVEVHYSGGPVILMDVIFVNCKFVFENVSNAHLLADGILHSTHIDFSLG